MNTGAMAPRRKTLKQDERTVTRSLTYSRLERLHYRVFGRWPDRVVDRRLSALTVDGMRPPANVRAMMRSVYENAGYEVPPMYRERS